MNILILGGDGYLGWSSALKFAKASHFRVQQLLERARAAQAALR